jgi:hypothetical protein
VGWAELVRRQLVSMGYECTINSKGGTGFVRAKDDMTFETLLTTAASSSITMPSRNSVTDIIVCGGYNDVSNSYSKDMIEDAIKKFVKKAIEQYPNANIYIGMVGTVGRWKRSDDGLRYINSEFKLRKELFRQNVLPAYQYTEADYFYLNGVENILDSRFDYMHSLTADDMPSAGNGVRDEIYWSDGIHPTLKGCVALANGIVNAFNHGNFF